MISLDPATLDFLTYIKKNNNKNSFELMRPLYEQIWGQWKVFTSWLLEWVKKIDNKIPESLDHKSCMFRIYRDARFTKWINPYKTNLWFVVWPNGKKSSYPSYYLHIEPGGSFLAWWVYRLYWSELSSLRDYLSQNWKQYTQIVSEKTFVSYFWSISGDELLKAPRWYDVDNPYIDLIKKKQHLFYHNYKDSEILWDDFMTKLLEGIKVAMPFVHFLSRWY